jgi:hypothetical protein
MYEDEFVLHFPYEELRNELTKFKGFEFATSIIKAKVVPIEMEKEAVSLFEETWVKATGFPQKAKRAEVIKEISHLVGDPQEVDEGSLGEGGVVRVRVMCKDALKVAGSTMVYINKQGHWIKWISEKMEEQRKNPLARNIKFNRHRENGEDSDDEADKE